MPDERGFLEAIAARPTDEVAWLIYADWLEERGDAARAEYLRVAAALGWGGAAAQRLEQLVPAVAADWRGAVTRLRAGLPMRFRIADVQLLGNDPPREMFDRTLTLVQGVLESGTVRLGDEVAIPLEGGGVQAARVSSLFTFRRYDYREMCAGQEPLEFAMMWPGHRHGIQTSGVIVPLRSVPPAEQRGPPRFDT
jgi:uncharacterized protein (TIGR02996 family)